MKLSERQRNFLREHASDDVSRLLLSASRYPELDVPFLAEQIASRRQIKDKLPSWYANDALVFPAKITVEQCSSELTAAYKQRLVGEGDRLCDLTGGLGIDAYFFSRRVRSVCYVERFPAYCEAARHNFAILGAENIEVRNEDSAQAACRLPEPDVFYIDPARRGEAGRRVYALADCEPDLPALLPVLLSRAPRVLAKLSPMVDIRQAEGQLPGTAAVHILSVRGECKEVLFDIRREKAAGEAVACHCVNIVPGGAESVFSFTWEEEGAAVAPLAAQVRPFLYEPNASVLKAGAFKSVAVRFGVEKLHPSSHLYTSGELVAGFPGRIFAVRETLPFSSRLCKALSREIPQANITARNFPLTADELRKKCKIKEGGDVYLLATTLRGGEKVIVRAEKVPEKFGQSRF